MPVFNYKDLNQIHSNLQTQFHMYINQLTPFITKDEYYAAFYRPGHVDALKSVARIVGSLPVANFLNTYLTASDGVFVRVQLQFNGGFPLPFPLYASEGIVADAPPELRARLTEFADERLRAGRAFGYAMDAIAWLNTVCDKIGTMKVMFPALPLAMVVADCPDYPLSKKAAKLAQNNSFGALPQLSPASRKKIQEASAFVSAVSLTRDNVLKTAPHGQGALTQLMMGGGYQAHHPDHPEYVPTVM